MRNVKEFERLNNEVEKILRVNKRRKEKIRRINRTVGNDRVNFSIPVEGALMGIRDICSFHIDRAAKEIKDLLKERRKYRTIIIRQYKEE